VHHRGHIASAASAEKIDANLEAVITNSLFSKAMDEVL
jgi:hypothetical protein